jgi:hypothetical protein
MFLYLGPINNDKIRLYAKDEYIFISGVLALLICIIKQDVQIRDETGSTKKITKFPILIIEALFINNIISQIELKLQKKFTNKVINNDSFIQLLDHLRRSYYFSQKKIRVFCLFTSRKSFQLVQR